jgi:hypothetical protein
VSTFLLAFLQYPYFLGEKKKIWTDFLIIIIILKNKGTTQRVVEPSHEGGSATKNRGEGGNQLPLMG